MDKCNILIISLTLLYEVKNLNFKERNNETETECNLYISTKLFTITLHRTSKNLKHIQTPTFSYYPKQILHPYEQHVRETAWVVIL